MKKLTKNQLIEKYSASFVAYRINGKIYRSTIFTIYSDGVSFTVAGVRTKFLFSQEVDRFEDIKEDNQFYVFKRNKATGFVSKRDQVKLSALNHNFPNNPHLWR